MSDLRLFLSKQTREREDQTNRKRYDRSVSPVRRPKKKKRPSRCSSEETDRRRSDKKKSFDFNKNNQESREVTLGNKKQEILISISGRNLEDTSHLPSAPVEENKVEKNKNEYLQIKAKVTYLDYKLKSALDTVDRKDEEIKGLQERIKSMESECDRWKVCSEENAVKLCDATSQLNDMVSKNAEYIEQQKSCMKIEPDSIKKEAGAREHGKLVETRKKLEASEKRRKEYKKSCLQKKKSLQLKNQEIVTLKSEIRNLMKRLQLTTKKSKGPVEGILTIDISE